ncbi:Ti-type conjugative transfer relaxase TraA [Methylobacterium radiotolerans]|uniref:Ti-type conjugative transfer relaxase TraA n=1 Tax=Methylobacterium radiotolerans TaxID=31998 RepID=UPI000975701F|nr:Ti-type conjugative transfer relaxase TraA [Methylobacterium radiotolerans]
MAIYHCSMKPVSRRSGRSAVAAAAYRAGDRLENARDGLVHDFTRRAGVVHAAIVLPPGVDADWAKNRSALWNAAERAEKRSDARVAREFEIALPHELDPEQRLALARAFAEDLAARTEAVVDLAVHAPHPEGDVRNHHAHLLVTTRQVTSDGLGEKTTLERENRWLLTQGLPTTDRQLVEIRQAWEALANTHLARAGLEARIDHRSHAERGLEIAPSAHVGVHATGMERRGAVAGRTRLDAQDAARNAALIGARPEQVLSLITGERSVFDRRDVARALHRAIDDAEQFQAALAAVMASPELVVLQPERVDPTTGAVQPARYSTRAMVALEAGLAAAAGRMHAARDHGVASARLERAIARQDAAIRASTGDPAAGLSPEQRRALGHVTGPERIAAVVGFAGAGKSTMLAAAREAWEAEGYRVHGAALAGKAAEGLEGSSGIRSRTLASWAHSWASGEQRLGRGDVLVIDEAGMVGSRQLAGFVAEAEARGAKLVLVGDHEQLQAIGAGAPFRAVAERIGHAELGDIRRQRAEWQRAASVAFATHRTAEGLAAYRARGAVTFEADAGAARGAIVRDYLADREGRREGSRVVLAHRRADVAALNAEIRAALQEQGALARGEAAGELAFQTRDGERRFAPGDRIVFLENDRALGVKNGLLGTVEAVAAGGAGAGPRIVVRLDGPAGEARTVSVPLDSYAAVDHGYATTIHKSQGATVDRAYVLASGTLDRHLTYVAMTRHREAVRLYAARDAFDERHAMPAAEAARAGQDAEAEARAWRGLESRLSRSGAKETVLDYAEAFAARRGIAEALGIRGDIRLPSEAETRAPAERAGVGHTPAPTLGAAQAGQERPDGREEALPPVQEARSAPAPFLAAVDLGEDGLEAAIATRVAAMKRLERPRAKLAATLAELVQDPAPLLAAIQAELGQPEAVFVERLEALLAAPERFGGLHGRTGLFASKAAKRQRDWALRSLPAARRDAGELKAAHEAQRAAACRDELAYRAQLRIALPGLSAAAEAAIRTVAQARPGTQDAAVARVIMDPALWPEIEAFARAAGARFGRDGSIGHRLEPRLPPDHGPVTPELRTLMNGAGLLAARLERREKLGEDLVPRRELQLGRERGPSL